MENENLSNGIHVELTCVLIFKRGENLLTFLFEVIGENKCYSLILTVEI